MYIFDKESEACFQQTAAYLSKLNSSTNIIPIGPLIDLMDS